jgi:coenzyme F420-reducing hydrogenase alpha subunit
VELLYACEEALRIVEGYEMPEKPSVDYEVRSGVGHGCTEAPRGICYHRYSLDAKGDILDARIAPPTAQNQETVERDLKSFVEQHMDLSDHELSWQCEQVVRNYDPCISCSCHALTVTIQR